MDTRTGNLVPLEELQAAMATLSEKDAKKFMERFVEVPAGDLPAVQQMNRKQRRAWAAQQRRARRAVPRG